MNHCKKPTQEKSPVEIIIHEGTNYLSSDKKPKNIANDIIKFAKSGKTDEDKVVVSRIPTRKGTINSKVKEVNTHRQDIGFTNNLPLIIYNNINSQCYINVKNLHLNSHGDKQLARNFINVIENG